MGTEIFLISTSLFTGGAERQAIWLANALSKSGYKVNLLILKKGDELSHLVNKDINILRFQIYSSASKIFFKYLRLARLALKTILRIRKIINNSNAQNKVIISFMFHSYVFGYLAKFAKSNVKLVYSVRSDRLSRRTSRKSKLRHLIFKLISYKAHAILFNSISGMEAFKTELNKNVPVYAYYKVFEYFIDIRYIYFYGYNGPYPLLDVSHWFKYKYGEHYSDFEHITMRFVKNKIGKLDLSKIYYGAHTTVEGVWKEPDQIEWIKNSPVSYIALHGHGNYPHSGIYPRIFGLGTDYCQQGFLWKPENIIYINTKNRSWYNYIGRFSKENEYSTLWEKTWGEKKPETNISTNPFSRFFYLYFDNYPKK